MSDRHPAPWRQVFGPSVFCLARIHAGRLYVAPTGTRADAPPGVWVGVGPVPDQLARHVAPLDRRPADGGPCPDCGYRVATVSHSIDIRMLPVTPRQAEPFTRVWKWQCLLDMDHHGQWSEPSSE